MSALFIYGTGATYTFWRQHSEKVAASRLTADRLDAEISYRVFKIFEILSLLERTDREIAIYEAMRDKAWLASATARVDPITHEIFHASAAEIVSKPGFEAEINARESQLRAAAAAQMVDSDVLIHSPPPENLYHSLHPEYKAYNLAALIALLRDHVTEDEQLQLDDSLKALTGLRSTPGDRIDVARRFSHSVVLERWRHRFGFLYDCPDDPLCIGSMGELPTAVTEIAGHADESQGLEARFWSEQRPYMLFMMLELQYLGDHRWRDERPNMPKR